MMIQIDSTHELHNGVKTPVFGLGTWQSSNGSEVSSSVEVAIQAGYRLIDTASIYRNEHGVGEGIRNSGKKREEIFLTSKVWNSDQGYDSTLRAYDDSLSRLGTSYLDLYLVHWPLLGQIRETWRAMEKIYLSGRVRSIGVSNFLVHHLQDLLEVCKVKPMVNQVEYHPWLTQPALYEFCKEEGIIIQAWAPIMRGKVFQIQKLQEIAEKYGKTPVHVALRWALQKGVVVIPKSVHADRIRQNAAIFDFELEAEEMRLIDLLDRNERLGPDPDNLNF